jgi:hypothetical protein
MKTLPKTPRSHTFAAAALVATAVLAWMQPAQAASSGIENATLTNVAVNGGSDSTNPGVTCIQVTPPPPASCSGGWIAIMNNNKQLVTTAVLAKATNARIYVMLEDAGPGQHCPWLAFTTCTVNTILLR